MTETVSDYDAIDFFRGNELVDDPYPYFDWLRTQCPVRREQDMIPGSLLLRHCHRPRHHAPATL